MHIFHLRRLIQYIRTILNLYHTSHEFTFIVLKSGGWAHVLLELLQQGHTRHSRCLFTIPLTTPSCDNITWTADKELGGRSSPCRCSSMSLSHAQSWCHQNTPHDATQATAEESLSTAHSMSVNRSVNTQVSPDWLIKTTKIT